jgi:G patch domain-containing protein 1
MDDEDMAELAENRKLVDTTEELDLTAGTAGDADEDECVVSARVNLVPDRNDDRSLARKLESALLPPPADSVGARILKKMGWRIGQGVGPRLTYRQKRLQDAAFGTAGDADMDVDEASEESRHTYAPRDTPLLLPSRKTDTHGLGYDSGTNLYQTTGKANSGAAQGPRISGWSTFCGCPVLELILDIAGFGLGALNEADDDDVDIYDAGPGRGRTQMAYDTIDHDDQGDIVMGGVSRRGPRAGPSSEEGGSLDTGTWMLTSAAEGARFRSENLP